jgi:hypothetical protein
MDNISERGGGTKETPEAQDVEKESCFWKTLEEVQLQLHDIQFQLCEFDKYQRVLRSEGAVKRYKSAQKVTT